MYMLFNNKLYDLESCRDRRSFHIESDEYFSFNEDGPGRVPFPREGYSEDPVQALAERIEDGEDELTADDIICEFHNQENMGKLQAAISSRDPRLIIERLCNFQYMPDSYLTGVPCKIVYPDQILYTALVAAGYEVEASNVSRSLYIQLDEEREIRISDHKRPAVMEGYYAYEWEYAHEIIFEGPHVPSWVIEQLANLGVKLSGDDYYLY